jgi:hypothetical protein
MRNVGEVAVCVGAIVMVAMSLGQRACEASKSAAAVGCCAVPKGAFGGMEYNKKRDKDDPKRKAADPSIN